MTSSRSAAAGCEVGCSLEDVRAAPSAVTIGFFDGVHRGHQSIIGRAIEHAEQRELRSVAVTFDRHPMRVVAPASVPPLLMTAERRVRTLKETGVQRVVVLEFDEELSRLSPNEFVDHVLVDGIDARHVVVGSNFRFGHKAAGDVSELERLGSDRGFDVEPVDLVTMDAETISSTAIREHLQAGDVDWAASALGRPFVVDGAVVPGEGRGGEQLGVPTANVAPSKGVQIPGYGIYAGFAHTPAGRVPAATSVGVRPMFDGRHPTVEAHLIDWDGDLYGQRISVEFAHRIRNEESFDSTDELIAQMQRDIARARELLTTH